jgi:hypothetical protein
MNRKPAFANANVMTIHPFFDDGTWMFTDSVATLRREPFVAGADVIISYMVEEQKIPEADSGFDMSFSDEPFDGHQYELDWVNQVGPTPEGGNNYVCRHTFMTNLDSDDIRPAKDPIGWLCPALFKYFGEAPRKIYVRVAPLSPNVPKALTSNW